MKKTPSSEKNAKKIESLKNQYNDPKNSRMTTDQGLLVNDTNNSLKAGERGSTLLEDFLLREKMTLNVSRNKRYISGEGEPFNSPKCNDFGFFLV